ncbi:N-acetylglucosamine 6-phosphate deacetylase [Austwickia chelonae]|uniref:N-acetylglucosamine-6-phosphate deacetylase n=1 Tax=Austwickia chelonae NBRC 105200 TaxID=1184607 RepID=K6VNU8_9MICO|nr:amidohydrolase family protein [Austwickia chelonae]GAB78414.1 N-acetylglucosamine-6-phosphate deacetylase [Austwickia chelonae NBRC 105200]SEW39335.1 N-acetylglucosamine 6-phosphate deacetylase [Austwickia chelonae]
MSPISESTTVPAALLRLDGTLVDGGRRAPRSCLVIEGDRIAYAGPAVDLPPHLAEAPRAPGLSDDLLLMPGLVDLHHHGAAGGEYGPDPEGCRRAIAHHRAHGSTTLVASLVSNFPDVLDAGVRTCSQLVAEGELAGIHLEGPFLSYARRGAQNPAALTDVDLDLVERLAATATSAGAPDALVQMTFAPERPGADELPAVLARHGIVGAVGHTDGTAAQARAAVERVVNGTARGGQALATHLFNGMRPLHHRDPGPIAGCLAAAAQGEAVLEAIGDGVHLDAGTVRMLFDVVGPDALALITDAMSACGMPPGKYTLGGQDVVVDGRTARLVEGDSIAGGVATMIDVLRWTVVEAGVSLPDAVTAATATPARVAGLTGAGRLVPGAWADVLAVEEQDRQGIPLVVRAVYRRGTAVEPG